MDVVSRSARPLWLGLIVLALLLGLCVRSMRKAEDYGGYVLVGETILAGGAPYADTPPRINTWPPLFGLVCVPLALLDRVSPYLGRGVWLLLGLAALLLVLQQVTRLVHGRALVLDPRKRPGIALGSVPVLVPLALASTAVIGNFLHLQINVLILALLLGALMLQARGREAAGGACLGVAIALRVAPLVFVPYLLWRRRSRTALAALGTALVLSCLPALVFGWEGFTEQLGTWRARAAELDTWGVDYMNQSLAAMWERFAGYGLAPFASEPLRDVARSGHTLPIVLTWATLGLLAAVALWRFRGALRPGGRVELLEWSVVLIVGAIGGPVTWKAYFVVLLLPLSLLWALQRDAECSRRVRRLALGCLGVGALFLMLPTRDLVGKHLARGLEQASVFTVGALLLIAGLFLLHAWVRAEPEPLR